MPNEQADMTAAPASGRLTPALGNLETGWLTAGIVWLLVGFGLLPSARVYQAGLVGLFWLPALLIGWRHRHRLLAALANRHGLLLGLFTLWSLFSLTWSDSSVRLHEVLIVVAALLSLLPFILLADARPGHVSRTLYACAMLLAVMALADLLWLYGYQHASLHVRAVGPWQLDNALVAGHYFGMAGILLVTLAPSRRGVAFAMAVAVLALFLLLCQSRGIWAALFVAYATERVLRLRARAVVPVLAVGLTVALVAWLWPHFILQRGWSYRPEIWREGLELWWQHFWLGLGLGSDYRIGLGRYMGSVDHAHNLFIHVGIVFGLVGFVLWLALWLETARRCWQQRMTLNGELPLLLWCFATVALLSDDWRLWSAPDSIWFLVWLPMALAFALPSVRNRYRARR